jgi:hypothetical protein
MARGLRPESAAAIAYRRKLRALREKADRLRDEGHDQEAAEVEGQMRAITDTRREMRDATRAEREQPETAPEAWRAVEARLQAEHSSITVAEIVEVMRSVARRRYLEHFPKSLDPQEIYRTYLELMAPDESGATPLLDRYIAERQEYINPAIERVAETIDPEQHPALQVASRFLYRMRGEYLATQVSDEVAAPADHGKPLIDQLNTFKFSSPYRDQLRLASGALQMGLRPETVTGNTRRSVLDPKHEATVKPRLLEGQALATWSDTGEDGILRGFDDAAEASIEPGVRPRNRKQEYDKHLNALIRENLWLFQSLRHLGSQEDLRVVLPNLDLTALDDYMDTAGYRWSKDGAYISRGERDDIQTAQVMEARLLQRRLQPVIEQMRRAVTESDRAAEQAAAEKRRARLDEFGRLAVEYQRVSALLHAAEERAEALQRQLDSLTWYQFMQRAGLESAHRSAIGEVAQLTREHETLERRLDPFADVVSDPVNAATTWLVRRTPDRPTQRESA